MLDLIEKRLAEGRPVRIRLLKARQLGFSTLFEAIIYAFTSRREGFHSLVIAHDDDGSKGLFEMNKLYHEKLDDMFKPVLKKSNEVALEFEGLKSRIDIDTSRNKRAGRSHTYQIVHKSETAYFAFPKDVNLGIANAVPDLPGTMIFDETTANGINFHYDDVQKSMRCEDGFDFIFVPWVMNPEYSMPAFELERTDEEKRINFTSKEMYDIELTDEQLSWRRFTIAHKCGGDIKLFQQEYPLTPEEAFIFSGRPRFDIDRLKTLKDWATKPISRIGLLDIYEEFDPLAKYIMGVDTSEGLISGDNSSVVILNCKAFTVAAHYSGKIAPDLLAPNLKVWGTKYNEAVAVIESNNHGLVTINYLKDIYKKIYSRKVFDEITNSWTDKLGFQTSARTKPLLIANLDKALRANLGVKAEQIVQELMTYVIEDDGSTNASEGKKDDDVIALALANQGYIETNEYAFKEEAPKPGPMSVKNIFDELKNPPKRERYSWNRQK